jgi:hypothetical protein
MQTTTKTHEPNNNKSITSSSQFHKGGKGTYILAPKFSKYFRKQIFDNNRNCTNSLATSLPHYSEQKTKKQKRKKKRYPGSLQFKTLLHKSLESPFAYQNPRPPNPTTHAHEQNKANKTNKQSMHKLLTYNCKTISN